MKAMGIRTLSVVGSVAFVLAVWSVGCSDNRSSNSTGGQATNYSSVFQKGKTYWVGANGDTVSGRITVTEVGPSPWVKVKDVETTGRGAYWINSSQLSTVQEDQQPTSTSSEPTALAAGPSVSPTAPGVKPPATSSAPASRPVLGKYESLRGIKWGEKLESIPGMKVISDKGGEKECTRDEELTAGQIPLQSVKYSFYKDRFYRCDWSLVLRRGLVNEGDPHVRAFRACVEAGHGLILLGPILQELLDGLRSAQQFARLLAVLEPVPLAPVGRETYVLAARMRNDCRKKGIQAGPTDFLIAAACVESGLPLLTADHDFARIAGCTELVLVPVGPPPS